MSLNKNKYKNNIKNMNKKYKTYINTKLNKMIETLMFMLEVFFFNKAVFN